MCTDCFNGCTGGPVSDKCVKYTGADKPELNIQKGDPLSSIEDNIIIKILAMAIGEEILPVVPEGDICNKIKALLPVDLSTATLNDYLLALVKVACEYDLSIIDLTAKISSINSTYILNCITGVDPEDEDDTHIVVQAIIDNLCTLKVDFDALALDLDTNYVKIADINSYIQAYLDSNVPSTLISQKMVPYVAMEYYGTLSHFDGTGAGIGDWDKIYLCNGANGTPDKRGRVAVGVTNVVGGGAYNPNVDPGNPDNPNYTLNNPFGNNTVTLTANQLPAHTHTATATVTDPGHFHANTKQNPTNGTGSVYNYDSVGDKEHYGLMNSDIGSTGITVSVTVQNTGGGDSHSNIQPVLPCYYIMYIP